MGRQEYQTQATSKAELMAKDGSNLDEEMATRTTAPGADDHILGQPLPHDRSDVHGRDDDHEHVHRLDTIELVRIGFVGLAVVTSWFQLWNGIASFDVIALMATAIGGYPIFKEAFENILERRMTMELSMTIALVSALAIGEVFTALVIVFFVLIAEFLEGLTVNRGRKAIKDLMDVLPRTADIRRADGVQAVDAAEIQIGDVVIIKPGGARSSGRHRCNRTLFGGPGVHHG